MLFKEQQQDAEGNWKEAQKAEEKRPRKVKIEKKKKKQITGASKGI